MTVKIINKNRNNIWKFNKFLMFFRRFIATYPTQFNTSNVLLRLTQKLLNNYKTLNQTYPMALFSESVIIFSSVLQIFAYWDPAFFNFTCRLKWASWSVFSFALEPAFYCF